MIGAFLYLAFLPLRAAAELVDGAARSGSRSRARTPRYSHGYCTIAHRSEGAAQRCAMTAAYRRVEAAAIAEERRQQQEAEYRAIARRVEAAEWNAKREVKRQRRQAQWEADKRKVLDTISRVDRLWIGVAAAVIVWLVLIAMLLGWI